MDKQYLIDAYTTMCRIRQFDTYIETVENKKLVGFLHSHCGEEAYSTAVISQLRAQDHLSTTYRNHAHSIPRGVTLASIAAELYGKVGGVCKGRAGNMHIADPDLNMVGAFGIIGAGVPATVGAAFAEKYKGTDNISVAFFGDGALPQGAVHESMNLASVMQIPVLFVNNNNHYAMSTPAENNLATDTTTNYAKAYGMHAVQCDGMDFFAAYECAQKVIEYIRTTGKPAFIEYDCFRYDGQWVGDTQDYKDKDVVAAYRQRDPMVQFKTKCLEQGYLSQAELENIEKQVSEEVVAALAFADQSDFPDMSDIFNDIYADVY